MNAAALRKHYESVRQRLNSPAKIKPKELPAVEPVVIQLVKQEAPTIELDPALKELFRYKPKERMKELLEGTGITFEDLKSDNRKKEIVRMRWKAYHVLLNEFGWSRAKIGKYFGKDHTTVLHGLKSLAKETNNDTSND